MQKKKILFISLLSSLFFLTACGITEELDQAKTDLTTVQESILNQKKSYQQVNKIIATITADFNSDLKETKDSNLNATGTSKIFKNIDERKTLVAELDGENDRIQKLKKQLVSINQKNGVDVDHDQLKLIVNSLAILNSNFESFKSYSEASFELEDDFYSNLPENIEDQQSLLTRSYGAIDLIAEEAQANIDYTNKLIKDFLKNAAKNPPLQHKK